MARTALIAVRDRSGLKEFTTRLAESHGFRILELEGCSSDESVFGPAIPSGEAERIVRAGEITLLVANYYDVESVGREYLSWKNALSSFDHVIVDLIRNAARQPDRIGIVGSPLAYPKVLEALESGRDGLSRAFLMDQACNAFQAVAEFDAAVGRFLETHGGEVPDIDALSGFPKSIRFAWKRALSLDSGETPRQKAALYGSFLEHFERIQGSEFDYPSIVDLSFGTYLIGEFEKPTGAIVKRGSLVNAASGDSLPEVIDKLGDSTVPGIKGATLVANGTLGREELEVFGPDTFSTALAPRWKEGNLPSNVRLVKSRDGLGYEALQQVASMVGGALAQDRNRVGINPFAWRMPSSVQPLVDCWEDMLFGVKLSRHLKSDGCVAVREGRVIALASDLPDQGRVWLRLAEFEGSLENSVLVFDTDIEAVTTLQEAKRCGIDTVVHPGLDGNGEARLIEGANEYGIALVATGTSLCKF